MEKNVPATWTLEDGAVRVEYTPTVPRISKNKKRIGEEITVGPTYSVLVRLDLTGRTIHVEPASTVAAPEGSYSSVQRRIQRLLTERLAWRRRLNLSMRMPPRSIPVPALPEANLHGAMIRTMSFNRIAKFARYMTHVKPAALILDRVYYWTWQAGALPLDPGPVLTRGEWQRLVGNGRADAGDAGELLAVSQVFSGLCNEGDAVDHTTIRAQLMDRVPEFAPRVRALYWRDTLHDVREMDRLLPILSAEGVRGLVFHPTLPELAVFQDAVAPDMQNAQFAALAACLVTALLGFSVDDPQLALDTVTDEQLQWIWTIAARWIDDRTMLEL